VNGETSSFSRRLLGWYGAAIVVALVSLSNAFAQREIPRVRDIHFEGVESIATRDLQRQLPFIAGDLWREDMPVSVKKSLVEYYAKRGFYAAKVEVAAVRQDPRTVAITVRVSEGPPCTVESIWIDDAPGFKSKSAMLRFKNRMSDIVKTSVGERYDEQTLSDHLRDLREWLVSEDFIFANTDRVRLTLNETKTKAAVVLAVDYGERVTFGYQGNTVFTKGELNDFVVQLRSTGLGKDYVGAIERKLLEEYRSRAYNNVKVGVSIGERSGTKHATFIIDEGVRSELVDLRWDGLSEQNLALAKRSFQKSSSRLIQRGYFVEKDVDKAVLIVLEDLKAHGFLSSKLVSKSIQQVKSPPRTHRVQVTIQLSEGELTEVGKIELSGLSYFPEEKVLSVLGLAEDKPFNPFSLEEGLQRLKILYVSEGFLDFRVVTPEDDVVTFTENNRSVNVKLHLLEGTRVRIGKIEIRGLDLTKEKIVSREVNARPEDWWLRSAVDGTEANIRKLGLFSEVKVAPAPSEKGPAYRDMVIQVKEADPGVVELGPGYRTDLGLRAYGRVSYNNIFGNNWIGIFQAQANRRLNNDYRFIEYQLNTGFIEPRLFGTKFLYSIDLSTKKQRFPPDFNAVSTQFLTGIERKFPLKVWNPDTPDSSIAFRLSYKLERIRQFDVFINNTYSDIDNRSMLIGSVVPSVTFDGRDSPFVTTSGVLSSLSLEYAQPQFSGQSVSDPGAPAYQKWNSTTHIYIPITKDIVWSNVVAGGFARSDIKDRVIPLIKLFRLGGSNTIRGFQEDSINVDDKKIFGTLSYLNLRTQIDLPLAGDLKFAPFLDAGNLYIDKLHNTPFFRAGAGAGFHYMTPVGPINLDWGYKLNPSGGETPSQIHFSVGLI
jgi:outer membrane protein assembly complex protein YaeT